MSNMTRERLWNANTHYHRILLEALPPGAKSVLDAGCGDGLLAAELADAGVPRVVALDSDAAVLERAWQRHAGRNIEWLHAGLLDANALQGPFDAVLSVATLHHLDARTGLARFAELVRPGGLVGVIGLAANDWWDWPAAALGQFARRAASLRRGYWEHSALMAWPPPATYKEMKRIAQAVLPGVRYRRLLYSRYALLWTNPGQQR